MSAPTRPAGLGAAGCELWQQIVSDVEPGWALDARDAHLLEQAARAVDRASELEATVAADGLMIGGSKGQRRLHPAVAESRQQRHLSAILIGRIELGPPAVKTGALSGRQRAELRRLTARAS